MAVDATDTAILYYIDNLPFSDRVQGLVAHNDVCPDRKDFQAGKEIRK